MSSSRARNFRRRGDDDGNDNDTEGSAVVKPTSVPSSSNKPKKAQSSAPKKLLSFADDEEEEGGARTTSSKSTASFKSKDREKSSSRLTKPSSSHKITSAKDRLASAPSSVAALPSNVQPQAGTYTKEALLELQKNTRTLAAPSSRPQLSSSEPKIILKGLLKPQSPDNTAKQASGLDSDEEEEQLDGVKGRAQSLSRRDKDDEPKGVGKESEFFPDQATIEAIRAKRERMRKSGMVPAPDYISLDGGTNHAAAEGLSDDDAEFQGRFLGERTQTGKKGVFEDVDERAIGKDTKTRPLYNDDDDDEEEKLWEEEQFKKGLGKRMDDGPVRITSSISSSVSMLQPVQQQQKYIYPTTSGYGSQSNVSVSPSIGGAVGVSNGLDVMSMSQQAEIARKALRENVQRLEESHGRTISSITKTDENLTPSQLNVIALEKSLTAAGEKYIFMQKLRDFVSVICEFLQEKGALIEEIEVQMQELNKKRASAAIDRRAADNDDEMEVEVAVKAAMSVFNERGSSNAMIAAATSAALAASATIREQANLPVRLDELGRDLNMQKRKDMEQRAAARLRKKAQFDSKRLSALKIDGSYQKIEGESSTDESDSETEAYKESRNQLLEYADKVFSDASEEYSQLSAVKEKFERWKRDYASSYRDAYMSLSVPAIFSPYVRLELLKWDPLHEDVDFFDMKWHLLLFDYSKPQDGSDFAADDADANLVPKLVEKAALTILLNEITHCWDMLSTKETRNAVSATSLVINYVPASSEALAELLSTIHTRLSEAVAGIKVPKWSPLVLKAVPSAAQVAAYRFGMSVRLMRNICLWKDILALPVLENLALDELLYGKVIPHLRSIASNIYDAVTRTERVVASLSGVWAGPNVTKDHSRKLQPLVDCVLSLGRTLEKKHVSGVTESETGGLARRLKKMLVELNEYDYAREIARTFHLKEAL